MKADFMTTRDETLFVEPDAALTSTIRAALPLRDIRSDLAQSHRLQAESLRALARYEQASARHLFATQMELDGYVAHLNQQAATFDAEAADVDHDEIKSCAFRVIQLAMRAVYYDANHDAKTAAQMRVFAGYWSERAFAASRKLQGSES